MGRVTVEEALEDVFRRLQNLKACAWQSARRGVPCLAIVQRSLRLLIAGGRLG